MQTLAPGMERVGRMEQYGRIYDPNKEEERQFMGPRGFRHSALPEVREHFNKMTPDEEKAMEMGMDAIGGGPAMAGMVAGRKAKSFGPLVKEALKNVDDLMLKMGKKDELAPKDIVDEGFRKVGIYHGVEGLPKFEIPDSAMRLKPEYYKQFSQSDSLLTPDSGWARLEDIIDHQQLFDEYPTLRGVKVRKEQMDPGDLGFYDPQQGTLTLSDELFQMGKEEQLKDVIVHEIQHKIQDLEDFALGGSPKLANTRKTLLEEWNEAEKEALDQMLAIKLGLKGNATDVYATLIQQADNGNAKAGAVAAQMKQQISSLVQTDPIIMQMRDKVLKYNREMKKYSGSNLDNYRRFAGEAEARETTRRRLWGMEERMQNMPNTREGGPDAEDLIVYTRGDELGTSVAANFKERIAKLRERIAGFFEK
jgi:hypothetical protein